jgi:hypothetical protein
MSVKVAGGGRKPRTKNVVYTQVMFSDKVA